MLIRPEASDVNLIVSNDKSECRITVDIPSSVHAYSVNQHKDVGSWSVELLHNCPGFGKPYLLKIRNSEKVDFIKHLLIPGCIMQDWCTFLAKIKLKHNPRTVQALKLRV